VARVTAGFQRNGWRIAGSEVAGGSVEVELMDGAVVGTAHIDMRVFRIDNDAVEFVSDVQYLRAISESW
jgi:hypothetical protein